MDDTTFWSDSMDLRLFKDVLGVLTVPGHWLGVFSSELRDWGCEPIDQRVVVPGTARLHPQWEITLPAGLFPGIVEKVEEMLAARSVKFSRTRTVCDDEILDIRWELHNVSVWK